MPIRLYRCDEGHEHERLQMPGEDYSDGILCGLCGGLARNVPAPFVADGSDGPGIRKDRHRELDEAGLIVREPGLDRDAKHAREYRQQKFERAVEREVAAIVRDLPARPD